MFYAHELSRMGGAEVDRINRALFDARVDLNPHQIEAALFSLRSPISKGVLFMTDDHDQYIGKLFAKVRESN